MSARIEYIKKYAPLIIAITKGTKIFPSVMMAQAILESRNGESILASKYNNHFGIKATKDWTGKTVNLNTREVVNNKDVYIKDNFRFYHTVKNSFKDHAKFLKENPRYTKGGVFSAKNPKQQTRSLQNSGYATSPKYASTLNWIIKEYKLENMDIHKSKGGISALWLIPVGFVTALIIKETKKDDNSK